MADWADNYNALATQNTLLEDACVRLGCTSDWADNYDDLATDDDGSCDRLGCMNSDSDNFDYLATTDDESCFRVGCMSEWADNFDVLATIDDGSCFRVGCMYETMLNYDALATIDDGTCDGESGFVTSEVESAEAVLVASHALEIDSLNQVHEAEVQGLENEILFRRFRQQQIHPPIPF